MALLFLDGFEQWTGYGAADVTINANSGMPVYWQDKMGVWSNSVVTSPVRTSQSPTGRALAPGTGTGLYLKIPTVTETYVGYGLYPTPGMAGETFFDILESTGTRGSKGIRLRFNFDFQIEVVDVSTSAILGTTTALPVYAWTYVEIKYIFAASGSLEIHLDTISALNLTNFDSRGGCSSVSLLGFCSHITNECLFDDLYICDSTGTINNTFLGPINVYTLFPNGDAAVQLTPSTGTDNYAMVDEVPVDSNTTFVQGTGGQSDLYELTDLPAITPTSIPGIMATAISCKTDNSGLSGEFILDSGGSTSNSSPVSLAANLYRIMYHIWDVAPGGASWTKTLIDALKAGFKGT